MGIAGAERIFALLDQKPEIDHGYVTLVQVEGRKRQLVETSERTGKWAGSLSPQGGWNRHLHPAYR